jgi:integrase
MNHVPSITIREPLKLPVRIIKVDGLPKVVAGGVPVTPINIVLARRRRYRGATQDSLDTYARAARLYVEFCAHLERSLTGISNDDFCRFKDALLNLPFPNAKGLWVHIVGKRERIARTADLMLRLLYSLAEDIESLYKVRFDWRRYRRFPAELIDIIHTLKGSSHTPLTPREHTIRWTPRKIVGLPDNQFALLIDGARKRWGDKIADGDAAFASNPETQRGALFYRNVAILFVLRFAGSRRREVTFIRLCDINRAESKIYLVTKGHGGENGERLPVILFPFVDKVIWNYLSKFRPDISSDSEEQQQRAFLSHSVRNYGQVITPQTVNKMIKTLSEDLDPPWNKILTPHMLRHSFGYQLQKLAGPASLIANMRHLSINSNEPYSAGVENFMDELLHPVNDEIETMLDQAGLLGLLRK